MVLLDISQNSHENTCARVSILIKLKTVGYQIIGEYNKIENKSKFGGKLFLQDCFIVSD